jgi:hypothetical protein
MAIWRGGVSGTTAVDMMDNARTFPKWDLQKVGELIATIEPLLRQSADQ